MTALAANMATWLHTLTLLCLCGALLTSLLEHAEHHLMEDFKRRLKCSYIIAARQNYNAILTEDQYPLLNSTLSWNRCCYKNESSTVTMPSRGH